MTSPTGPSSDRRAAVGFTLFELIAVLVLISTVLAIAAPSLRGFVHGRQTADTAARMLALTHLARSRAVTQGCTHRLEIDVEQGRYGLTMQQAGAFVEIEGSQGREHLLPIGVTARLVSEEEDEPLACVEFHPDGRCDAVTIELSGADGDVLYLTCTTPSERFRIVSEMEDETR